MHVELQYPAGWLRTPLGDGEAVTVPGYVMVPDVTIEVHALQPRHAVDAQQLVASRLPRGTSLEVSAPREDATASGWPMAIVDARAIDGEGRVRELRLLCAYRFLAYAALVLVRASSVERLESTRASIMDVLRTARPRFRGTFPAQIAELWEMDR